MNNYFAKNLKYIRKKRNIDQQVMAEDLGVAQSTLSCWESGIRTPDLDMIVKITNYLNIKEDFITKDLTLEDDNKSFDELELLFNKNKEILTDDDKEYMKFIIEKRKKEIDKQFNEE